MSDIFISYAHEDRQRIIPIAKALEQAGFSVWWDREIRAGEDFDEVIETELETAACVIVGWSASSRTSRYVKGEAREAVDRGVLAPIFLEQVKPPLDLRSLHTEDFSNWQGDQNADCWQRLILQADALKQDAQKNVPVLGAQISTEPTTPNAPSQPEALAAPTKTSFNAGAAFLSTTLPLMAAAWFLGNGQQMGIMGLTATLALMAFLLMRQADRDLHPHMKALATRWLMPQEGHAQVNMPEGFLRLFEAVFGRKHWSWRCLWRSAVASTLGLLIMLVVFDYFQTEVSLFDILYSRTEGSVFENSIRAAILLFMIPLLGIPANILGDYLSLWETRKLLQVAARRPTLLPLLIPLDTLLTLLIWLTGLASPIFVLVVLEGDSMRILVNFLRVVVDSFSQGLFNLSEEEIESSDKYVLVIILGAMLATSFITSVWLWLSVLVTPLVRFLLWSRTSGLSALGRFINTEQKPFTALGYLSSLIIMIVGTAIWGLSFL